MKELNCSTCLADKGKHPYIDLSGETKLLTYCQETRRIIGNPYAEYCIRFETGLKARVRRWIEGKIKPLTK